MSVPYRNRTYNRVLGGPRYIHLTKGTNAVFSGFFSLLATVAISMNPITFVMNFYCNLLWHPGQSLLESNSDLSLLNFRRCQPWLNLRRRVLYPAELWRHMPQTLDFTGFLGFFPSAIYKIINSFSSCQSTDFFDLVTLERSPIWGMLCCHP